MCYTMVMNDKRIVINAVQKLVGLSSMNKSVLPHTQKIFKFIKISGNFHFYFKLREPQVSFQIFSKNF